MFAHHQINKTQSPVRPESNRDTDAYQTTKFEGVQHVHEGCLSDPFVDKVPWGISQSVQGIWGHKEGEDALAKSAVSIAGRFADNYRCIDSGEQGARFWGTHRATGSRET